MNVLPLPLGPLGTNCYLVWDEPGGNALLVDCAGTPRQILAPAQERGLSLAVIVLTHGHMDHTERLAELVQRTAAEVAIHELDAPLLRDPMLNGAALFGYPHADATPDRLLREGDAIALAGAAITLTVLHTPGHTPGSICLLGEGALFSGDTLFAGSIGRTDLPGGDETEMAASLQRLTELPEATTVYPGHGPTTTLREEKRHNPWLTREVRG